MFPLFLCLFKLGILLLVALKVQSYKSCPWKYKYLTIFSLWDFLDNRDIIISFWGLIYIMYVWRNGSTIEPWWPCRSPQQPCRQGSSTIWPKSWQNTLWSSQEYSKIKILWVLSQVCFSSSSLSCRMLHIFYKASIRQFIIYFSESTEAQDFPLCPTL